MLTTAQKIYNNRSFLYMLKVLAAVLAVLSAAISITIYTATLPDVQKQAADNAEQIEQIQSAVENIPTEEKKLYYHLITLTHTASEAANFNCNVFINITTTKQNITLDDLKILRPKTASGYIRLLSSNYYYPLTDIQVTPDNSPYPGAQSKITLYYFNTYQSSNTPTGAADLTATFTLYDTVSEL